MLGAEKPPPRPSRAGEPGAQQDYRGGVTRTEQTDVQDAQTDAGHEGGAHTPGHRAVFHRPLDALYKRSGNHTLPAWLAGLPADLADLGSISHPVFPEGPGVVGLRTGHQPSLAGGFTGRGGQRGTPPAT